MTVRTVLIVNMILYAVGALSQRKMVVIDADTKVPVRNVQVFSNDNQQMRTAWNGRFTLSDSFSRINLRHPHYEQRYLLKSELHGDTIYLLPKANALGEVVIWGERRFDNRMKDILKPSPQQIERHKSGICSVILY